MRSAFKVFLLILLSAGIVLSIQEEAHGQNKKRGIKYSRSKGKGKKRVGPNRGMSSYSRYRHWILEAGFSASHYFGDLAPTTAVTSTDLTFTRPQIAYAIRRNFHPKYSWRAEVGWHQLRGDDNTSAPASDLTNGVFRANRNLHFRNNIFEFTWQLMIDFKSNPKRYDMRLPRTLYPYLGIGAGLMYHNPQAKRVGEFGNNAWVDLKPLELEGRSYSRIQPVFPITLGFRIRATQRIDLGAELGLRLTLTDYLDDVSGNYATDEMLGNDPFRIAMANRMQQPLGSLDGSGRTVNIDNIPDIRDFVNNGGKERRGSQNFDNYIIYGFRAGYHFGGKSKPRAPSTGHFARSRKKYKPGRRNYKPMKKRKR